VEGLSVVKIEAYDQSKREKIDETPVFFGMPAHPINCGPTGAIVICQVGFSLAMSGTISYVPQIPGGQW